MSLLSVFLLQAVPDPEPASDEASSMPASQSSDEGAAGEEALSDLNIFDILDEDRTISLGTGGRTTTVRQAPGSMWVVDRRSIKLTAATSLYDTLRHLPGQITKEISAGQTEQNLRFPGSFPENQTLVLVDGQNVLSDPLGIYDRSLLNLRDLERVEVVFGPSSTLYVHR